MPDDTPYFSNPTSDDDSGLPNDVPTTNSDNQDVSSGPMATGADFEPPPITDDTPEVDLSAQTPPPPPPNTNPSPLPPISDFDLQKEPTPEVVPTHPAPLEQTPTLSTTPPTLPKSAPATPPSSTHKSSSAVAFSILGLLTLFFAAASAFLYTQNQALKRQIQTLTSIEEQRQLPVPTPTTEATSAAQATPAATISPSSNLPLSAFADLQSVIALAQTETATAQLLMITSDNILSDSPIYKYWFRRGPGIKAYFFVQKTDNENPKLFSSATVNPDNDIPDLLPQQKANQLGLDSTAAYEQAYTQVVKPRSTGVTPSSVTAKYLKATPSSPDAIAPTNLWQLTFKFPSSAGISDIVVQLDALTKKVLFTNLPTSNVTPTPAAQ